MRDGPRGVHAVAVEPAAELVEQATPDHVVKSRGHPVEGGVLHRGTLCALLLGVADQAQQRNCRRERRCTLDHPGTGGDDPRRECLGVLVGVPGRRPALLRRRCQGSGELAGHSVHLRPVLPPGPHECCEELRELVGPEVGTGEERPTVGVGDHRHRPAALPGERLGRLHVDGVDARVLLPVDLHRHETGVDLRGDVRIREALPRHDMAPVTGGVTDRQEDRDIPAAGLGEGLRAPGPPVDRVVGVLTQVRGGGVSESVRCAGHAPTVAWSRAHLPPW